MVLRSVRLQRLQESQAEPSNGCPAEAHPAGDLPLGQPFDVTQITEEAEILRQLRDLCPSQAAQFFGFSRSPSNKGHLPPEQPPSTQNIDGFVAGRHEDPSRLDLELRPGPPKSDPHLLDEVVDLSHGNPVLACHSLGNSRKEGRFQPIYGRPRNSGCRGVPLAGCRQSRTDSALVHRGISRGGEPCLILSQRRRLACVVDLGGRLDPPREPVEVALHGLALEHRPVIQVRAARIDVRTPWKEDLR